MTTTIFVDRKTELADLEDFLKHPPQGPHRNIALIAPRRTGKTELIKAFRRRNPKAFLPLVEVQRADISASGRPNKKPWPRSIPIFRTRVNSCSVSIPSAIIPRVV